MITRLPTKYNLVADKTSYPLEINIKMPIGFKKTRHSIICTVPFPKGYPMTPFHILTSSKLDRKNVAKLDLSYDEEQNDLEIDLFYVYSSFSDMKQHINKGEELKGFGLYMLCKVLHYLLSEKRLFFPTATVSLTAAGNQCYDIEKYKDYTIENCLDIIKPYPESLFYSFFNKDYLKKISGIIETYIPNVDMDNVYNDIEKREIVNDSVIKLIKLEEQNDPEKLLSLLRQLVCEINDNQRLIEYNYKSIYKFEIVENKGNEAKMKGTVANILAACDAKSISKFRSRSSPKSKGANAKFKSKKSSTKSTKKSKKSTKKSKKSSTI